MANKFEMIVVQLLNKNGNIKIKAQPQLCGHKHLCCHSCVATDTLAQVFD
jgi:hypothetical protein